MNKFKNIAPVIAFIAFIYYALKSMNYSFTLKVDAVSRTSVVELFIIGLSVLSFVIIKPHNINKSKFCEYWIFWIIWVCLIFIIGLGGSGLADIFHMMFCPMCFLLFYNCSAVNNDFSKAFVVSAVALFIIVSYQHVVLSNAMTGFISVDIFASSNFIYWPLCCTPFLFLVKKEYIRNLLLFILVLDVVVSQKRAPLIAICIIILVYILKETKSSSLLPKLLLVASVVVGFFVISNYYGGYVDQLVGRVEMLSEDEGSGRIPLWNDVFKSLDNFDFIEIIFGRGYQSIKLTGHTNAHNDALQMLYEYGIIGMLFYITMVFMLIKRTVILFKKNSCYSYGYFATIVILLVMGTVSNLVVSNDYFAFLCSFLGFVEAQIYVRKDYHAYSLN